MNDTIRIWRSSNSAFGPFLRRPDPWQEETVTALDVYTDDELARIVASGFNAIWVHGNPNNVVRTRVFPELGCDAKLHQERMNRLVDRARKHDVGVFMYCQPGRGIPCDDDFWLNNPGIAGQVSPVIDEQGAEVQVAALCTSTGDVHDYLGQAAAELARKIPGLNGLIMITASEYPAHCYSQRWRDNECPRCAERKPVDVVSEVIRLVRNGVRSVNAEWRIIAWNWSWSFYIPPPCEEIINNLPDDVILLVDFERGGRKLIAGRERSIDEYSLSYPGPSEQFMESLKVAGARGLEVMAKLQFGTTHELATVPNIPVLGNVFAKADSVRKMKLPGFMGCWNFGNMLSANTAAFNAFLLGKLPEAREGAMLAFVAGYFPACDAQAATRAFLKFGEAMDSYPFCIPYLYSGPTNFACILPVKAGPLDGKPLGRSWLLDERGHDMTNALGDYSVDELVNCFEVMTSAWREGLLELRQALSTCAHVHAREELNTAAVCWHSFRSALNFIKIYCLRREWNEPMLSDYLAIIRDELANLVGLLPIVREDARFGYHIEAHGYQYDADRISQRITELARQLKNPVHMN